MSSPSFDPSRSHTSHPTLDPRVCADIGQLLAKVRNERKLTVDELSSRLLLSTRQVRALEAADVSAFHNASFFMIGLRKYAAFCGIAREVVDAAVIAVPEDEQPIEDPLAGLRDTPAPRRDWTPLLAILGLCALLAVGWGVVRVTRASGLLSSNIAITNAASSNASTPSATPSTDAPAAAPVSPDATTPPSDPSVTAPPGEVPAAAPPSQAPGALAGQVAYGSLWSPVKAWMFLRMENDVVIERTVTAGELVQLPGRPKYLAIGTGDAELTIGITPVDVSKFVQKGTLRMGVAEFGLAEQNVLGGSIPDPAEPSQR
ncbi:MAG: helix-turn-helix domain-containing protein [Vicinamibacterales bacterium]